METLYSLSTLYTLSLNAECSFYITHKSLHNERCFSNKDRTSYHSHYDPHTSLSVDNLVLTDQDRHRTKPNISDNFRMHVTGVNKIRGVVEVFNKTNRKTIFVATGHPTYCNIPSMILIISLFVKL